MHSMQAFPLPALARRISSCRNVAVLCLPRSLGRHLNINTLGRVTKESPTAIFATFRPRDPRTTLLIQTLPCRGVNGFGKSTRDEARNGPKPTDTCLSCHAWLEVYSCPISAGHGLGNSWKHVILPGSELGGECLDVMSSRTVSILATLLSLALCPRCSQHHLR